GIPLRGELALRIVVEALHVTALVGHRAAVAAAVVAEALAGRAVIGLALGVEVLERAEGDRFHAVHAIVRVGGTGLFALDPLGGDLQGLVAPGVVLPLGGDLAAGQRDGVHRLLDQVTGRVITASHLADSVNAVGRIVV